MRSLCSKSRTTICPGVCIVGTTGKLGDYCLCIDGYSCNASTRRLLAPGHNCANDKECITSICALIENGGSPRCLLGKNDGDPCNKNNDCHNDNCSMRFCQPTGMVTGSLGAVCNNQAHCLLIYTCVSTTGQSGGVCSHPTSDLRGPCSSNSDCYPLLSCIEGSCLFNNLAPNRNTPCIDSMQYDKDFKVCVNNVGITCNDRTMCPAQCTGPATITRYIVDNTTATAESILILPTREAVKKFLILANISVFILVPIGILLTNIDPRFLMTGVEGIWTDDSGTVLIMQQDKSLFASQYPATTKNIPKWSPYNGGRQLDEDGNPITIQEFAINSTGKAAILTTSNQVYEKPSTSMKYNAIDTEVSGHLGGIYLLGNTLGVVNSSGQHSATWLVKDKPTTMVIPNLSSQTHLIVQTSSAAVNFGGINAMFLCSNVSDDSFYIRTAVQGKEFSVPLACDESFVFAADPVFVRDKFVLYATSLSSCSC